MTINKCLFNLSIFTFSSYEKVLVLCETWLTKFLSNIYILRPHWQWVRKNSFSKVSVSDWIEICHTSRRAKISDVQNNSIRLESAFRRDGMSDFSSTDSSVSRFPTFEYEQALSRMSDFRQPITRESVSGIRIRATAESNVGFSTTDSNVSRFPTFQYEQALSRMSDFRQPTIEM